MLGLFLTVLHWAFVRLDGREEGDSVMEAAGGGGRLDTIPRTPRLYKAKALSC